MAKTITPWFQNEPSVFEEEKSGLEALGFTLDAVALERDRAVIFTGKSKEDTARELKVIFPSGYPSFPPEIIDDGKQPLLSRHQSPDHAFCLFGPDRIRWISSMNATAAVAEAETLIRDYPPNSTTALEHEVPEPVSDLLPNVGVGGFLVPPEIVEFIANSASVTAYGECQLMVTADNIKRGVILSGKLSGKSTGSDAGYQQMLRGQIFNATLIRLEKTPPIFSATEGPSTWLNAIPKEHQPNLKRQWFVFAYPEESRTAKQTELAFTVLHVQHGRHDCYRGFVLSPERIFSRIPGLELLAGKKVVILGVGSLGSRIAVCLAASGVRFFHLVDHDIYEPANAVRHECGFTAFGLPKYQVVASRMKQANAHIQCTAAFARIGILNDKAEADLLEKMEVADLIIDATGSELAGHWIHRRCQFLQKTCLHVAVANGAWSGEVIRAIPGQTPCWVCHHVGHDHGPAEPKGPGGYFAPGCAHPTFTGTMSDVSIVADLAASMAIETLLARSERDFGGSHIQWKARSASGQWKPSIEVTTPAVRSTCPVCSPKLKSLATSS